MWVREAFLNADAVEGVEHQGALQKVDGFFARCGVLFV